MTSKVLIDEDSPDPCALGKHDHRVREIMVGLNLWQMKCTCRPAHRTRFYPDRRAAVMAWNRNQHNKRTSGKKHG